MGEQLMDCGNLYQINKASIMPTDNGDVLSGIKSNENGFAGFGEAYFSLVNPGAIKAWKLHKDMTSNLLVPKGVVKFVLFKENEGKMRFIDEVILSRAHYFRLTIEPGVWFGFKNISSDEAIILNIANIKHDPAESERKPPSAIEYDWEIEN
jgi:dTDP-4-dehydrorhamnose 3,5-epimerase